MEKILYVGLEKTPIGDLTLAASSRGLAFLSIGNRSKKRLAEHEGKRFGKSALLIEACSGERSKMGKQRSILKETVTQLANYFDGRLTRFRIKKDFFGLSDFEKNVLQELDRIPCGRTASYMEIAKKVGKPKASRAVGNAVGKNPFSIIVPCHRVIRSDGSLGGFGGPITLKKNLLLHEEKISRR